MVRICTYLSFVVSIMKQQLTSVKGVIELDVSDIAYLKLIRVYITIGVVSGRV